MLAEGFPSEMSPPITCACPYTTQPLSQDSDDAQRQAPDAHSPAYQQQILELRQHASQKAPLTAPRPQDRNPPGGEGFSSTEAQASNVAPPPPKPAHILSPLMPMSV